MRKLSQNVHTIQEKFQGIYEREWRLNPLFDLGKNSPLRWRKSRVVRVRPTSLRHDDDLFHEDVPVEWIDRVFAVMALCPHLTFQVLTKRPGRMAEYLNETWLPRTDVRETAAKFGIDVPVPTELETRRDRVVEACEPIVEQFGLADTGNDACWDENDSCKAMMWRWPLPNVHLGVSCENQKTADERIPELLRCPAAVRFLSVEPLLEAVRLAKWLAGSPTLKDIGGGYVRGEGENLHWVIVGGESGRSARPCNVEWVRSIVGQCKAARVPCFVKQLGTNVRADGLALSGWPLGMDSTTDTTYTPPRIFLADRKGGDMSQWPEDLRIREFPTATTAEVPA